MRPYVARSNKKKEMIVLRLTCKVSQHTKLVVHSYSTSNVVGITEQLIYKKIRAEKKSFFPNTSLKLTE